MQFFSLAIIALVCLLCIVIAHRMAKKKGLNAVFWGVLGGTFGPLVFPVLIMIPSRKSPADRH
jgi:phosphotransferase system  glucose/maltose/N-acetylglucosamine-specific IIC component